MSKKRLLKQYPWAIAVTGLEDGCGQTYGSCGGDGITRALIELHGVYATEAEATDRQVVKPVRFTGPS